MAASSWKNANDRDICALAKEYEIAMLLVTKGAEGVVVCYERQVHHFAGMSVIVDSTGGGRCVRCRVTHRSVLYGIIYR